ncbi:unnamed protein product, partial [Dovyalis caffra]
MVRKQVRKSQVNASGETLVQRNNCLRSSASTECILDLEAFTRDRKRLLHRVSNFLDGMGWDGMICDLSHEGKGRDLDVVEK